MIIPSDLIFSDVLFDCYFCYFFLFCPEPTGIEVTVDDLHSSAISVFQRFFISSFVSVSGVLSCLFIISIVIMTLTNFFFVFINIHLAKNLFVQK